MIEAVVKVGGSLCRRDWLRPLGLRLAEVAWRHALVVVPGGGPFADAVRAQDARVGLGDSTAHWMAILGMDQYGWLLTDWIPGSEPVWTLSAARAVAGDGRVPVLLPCTLLYESDPLPHTWGVTSDSIGAWAAVTVGAPLLVLLKDVDGVFDAFPPQGEASRLRERVKVEELGRYGVVDAHLPGLVARYGLDLWLLNGRRPERLAELLATGAALGTHVEGGLPDPTG
jgi:aspartokinase-like uncharacterized kinase